MSQHDPIKWIQEVLGTELWETQKHVVAAIDKSPAPVEAIHGVEARRRLLGRWANILVRTNSVWPHADPISDLHHWAELFNRQTTPTKFYWLGSDQPKWFQAYAKQEAEAAKRKTIGINSSLSPAELVVIDEAARISPFEWEQLAEATRALRAKPAQPADKRPPLHKPQPWNPPVAKRRKR